jgi:hypothetical protein
MVVYWFSGLALSGVFTIMMLGLLVLIPLSAGTPYELLPVAIDR